MNSDGNGNKQQKLVYNVEDHEFGLLPEPLHFGRYMREKRIHFQLPYDLWWLSENALVSVSDCSELRIDKDYKKDFLCVLSCVAVCDLRGSVGQNN